MLPSSTHCAKNKRRADNICGTHKCLTNNFYQNVGITRCPYYIHDKCGHNGKLKYVKGIKIRKTLMLFNLGIYVPILTGLLFFFFFMDLFRQTHYMVDASHVLPILLLYILLPNFICTLFMGRVIAVCNKKGIYTNGPLVAWNEIDELRFTALLPARHHYKMSYLEIIRKNGITSQIPYMTVLIFIIARHYDKNIRIKLSKSTIFAKSIAYGIAILGAIVLIMIYK